MGEIRWDTALIIIILFLVLFSVILTQIKVPNPITQTPTSVWNWIGSELGNFFSGIWHSIF